MQLNEGVLSLQLGVYLLADVFQNFRNIALHEDGIEPLHLCSIPGLPWASAFKMTGSKVDLLQDICMYEWYESAIRGGLSFVNIHHSKRRNDVELLYVDVNNLYGWALSESLPCRNFQWIYDEVVLNDIMRELPTMQCATMSIGYVLEVDVSTPPSLHNYFDDLPPCCHNAVPPPQFFHSGCSIKTRKLITTHLPKQNYIIHYRLLQLFLVLGLKVTKIHRAVSFTQEPIFREYVTYNTIKRAATTNESERNYYKLKNNSLYGKCMENVRKRLSIRLCNTAEKLVTENSQTTFRRSMLIQDDFVAAFHTKSCILLDKPIYIGQAVLDLSKFIMYDLWYKMQKYAAEFHGSIKLIAGDTDSFFMECRNITLNEQLLPKMQADGLLDTSNYSTTHPLYSQNIASKLGCIKDESCGVPFVECIFLQPKCYSLLNEVDKYIRRAKGVQRVTLQDHLTHVDYKSMYDQFANVFHNEGGEEEAGYNPPLSKRQRRIGSMRHQLYTYNSWKIALSCRDNKRQWIGQNTSLAFGHYALGQHENGGATLQQQQQQRSAFAHHDDDDDDFC